MKTNLLCLFSLALAAYCSSGEVTTDARVARGRVTTKARVARGRVIKEGYDVEQTAINLNERWPKIQGFALISQTAQALYFFLTGPELEVSFWASGGAPEINAYADSLDRDNRTLLTISKPEDEVATHQINGILADLQAKLRCWLDGQHFAHLWGPGKAWPALRVCVNVSISSKDGAVVPGYRVAANPFTREDDNPPNCAFPDQPPYVLCLPPGYYKIWLEKGGDKVLPRYVSVGLAGNVLLPNPPPETILFEIGSE